jgi:branched-chain amino acid transport system ATP-binding protein
VSKLLEITGLKAGYGSIAVVRDLNVKVAQGEIVTLLGANGAGKSTTLKAIMGLVRPMAGKILVDGTDTAGLPAFQAAKSGLALVPEGRRVFRTMTVQENLEVGGVTRPNLEARETLERMYELFPRLRERHRQLAGTLSGGEQQMVAIARALMSRPAFILMDEPSLGLAPLVVAQVFEAIRRIQTEMGCGVLLVEQNAEMALSVAERGYVMTRGNVVVEGAAADLRGSALLNSAYLGMQPA